MILNRVTLKQSFHQMTFISLLTLSSTLCFAGVYKWVDGEGNIHYGQQRPADTQSESMDVQMHAPVSSSTYQKPGSEKPDDQAGDQKNDQTGKQEDGTQQKPQTAEEPVEKKETAAEKQRRLTACAKARKTLATMSSQGRVRSKDKEGNISYLSQEQKEAKIKQHKRLIAKHCQ